MAIARPLQALSPSRHLSNAEADAHTHALQDQLADARARLHQARSTAALLQDPALLRSINRALEALDPRPAPAPARPSLHVHPDGRAFATGGASAPTSLARRASLRRILRALTHAHQRAPDTPLTAHDLVDAGWPDQTLTPQSGLNRVYTAVRTLRRLGLGSLLLTRDGGYLLDPALRLTLDPNLA